MPHLISFLRPRKNLKVLMILHDSDLYVGAGDYRGHMLLVTLVVALWCPMYRLKINMYIPQSKHKRQVKRKQPKPILKAHERKQHLKNA